ncbi:transcriptional regulator, LysR family [Methylophaga frappieri]|uniref:Transcriptional regulator, LysR family n=1 Tax=Methylophaga frappieri (strain ATCC BAA-2434 / DSM 25690 / JAM7) TaxID=754477 RepID=I1YJX6_METFJ|nr:LysR family transcriptional regulator [Methylophaga frappieri]AFJ03219.1 transcriptional regulator, LysR family [Methylophaga frappieri]
MSLNLQQLLNRLTFRQLQVFHAVYHHRGYRRASEALGLTQPAVSSQIRKLEEAVEAPLFEYVGRKLYSTPAGEKLAETVRGLFEQLGNLQSELQALRGQLAGELNLCLVNTAQYVVPHILKGFLQLYPGVRASLRVVNRAGAIEGLTRNRDDLVIMGLVPTDKPLSILPFLDNALIPVMGADYPLDSRKPISLRQFVQQPLLMREAGSGSRLALEQYCQQRHLTARPMMEMGSIETLKQGVMAGLGVAVVPQLSVVAELQSGLLRPIPIKDFNLRRSWCLVHPKGKHLSPVAQAFYDYVQQNLADISQQFDHFDIGKLAETA